jgi:hypothetical protein
MGGGVEQQSLDVTRVGPRTHHIQQPVAAVPVAAELDAPPTSSAYQSITSSSDTIATVKLASTPAVAGELLGDYDAGPPEAIMEQDPPLLPVAWERINEIWYN